MFAAVGPNDEQAARSGGNREQAVLFLEQHERLGGGAARERAVRRGVDRTSGCSYKILRGKQLRIDGFGEASVDCSLMLVPLPKPA